jgi:signal transduction histidine kinase
MGQPRFVAEMGTAAHRPRLFTSIVTGYLTCAGFLLLAGAAHVTGLVPFRRAFAVAIAVKLVTNTAAWIALRANKAVLTFVGINVFFADIFALTCAVYGTGGALSPLFTAYVIEVAVVALLGNVELTLATAFIALTMFGTMTVLIYFGVLDQFPLPAGATGRLQPSYIAIYLAYAAFVLGVPTYYTARILRDLRDKQRALEERTGALIEAGRQKSQFMANVTHELRTPIHGICGLVDLLDSGVYGELSAKQRDAQQTIKRSAKGLLALIDDLLELSRSDAGKLEMQPTDIDVRELVPTVVAATKWMIGTKPLVLDTELEDDLPTVHVDRRGLNQVLINLLSNAAKFTPEGGRVVVRAKRHDDRALRIEIADSGIGIAPEEKARIFDEFHQIDGTAERSYGGVGLGLAVVARLTRAMGARVEVESTPGNGSTFSVILPPAREAGAPTAS